MTTPTPRAPITHAELHDLWQRQDQRIDRLLAAQEKTTQAIAQMREANAERDARHDREMAEFHAAMAANRVAQKERDDRHDKEMTEIRANIAKMSDSIDKLTEAQHRTNQDVGTLKGWGLEIYCERNPEIFAEFLGLKGEDLIPKRELRRIADEARMAGFITIDQFRNLSRADVFIYARQIADSRPVCLVVEASYQVDNEDVYRAADRAEILRQVLQEYQPRNLNGQVIPVVAGTRMAPGAESCAKNYNVTYVPVQNGNQLTNPPE